jgi:hypothetical protein
MIETAEQATIVAEALGGEEWDSGGGVWLIVFHRQDGRVVAISDEVVCEYKNEEALQTGKPSQSIMLH